MPYDVFMIAPLNTGLEKDIEPWLLPEDAFARLKNAYIYRGRVRKRFGATLMDTSKTGVTAPLYSRLRIKLATNTLSPSGDFTNGGGAVYGTHEIGQMFSIEDTIFTVYQAAGAMYSTGAATGTFDTTTGMINITGNGEHPNKPVYYYPAKPVMGLISYEKAEVNNEPVYAFDTQFSYYYTAGAGWDCLDTATIWSGTNSDFFLGYNYRGINAQDNYLYVTNYVAADQMKYWNGGAPWLAFHPLFNATDTIETALIITVFKDRMLLLNTKEKVGAATNIFVNRCRYSWRGDPTHVDAFRRDIGGHGGYVDAPTKEAIISVRHFRDRLVVFFEKSTWELVFTGDTTLPFLWQRLNSELGVESTFSTVNFDKAVLGVGNVGVHACNGVYVERIDEKIPIDVYRIHNGNDGIKRVHGIRDYYTEVVYWTFPSASDTTPTFPTRVLVYNYLTGAWAYNDDSITTFGYHQPTNNMTWASWTTPWQESTFTWEETAGLQQALNRQVIAGNQEGFTFIVDTGVARNSPALQITNIAYPAAGQIRITAINHNLKNDSFVLIENVQGTTFINDKIYAIAVIDKDTFDIWDADITGVYTGGGTITRVSKIDILTKQYNFYVKKGLNCFIQRIDFGVGRTSNGEFSVDYYLSTGRLAMNNEAIVSGYYPTDEGYVGVVDTAPYALRPIENTQSILYHPLHINAEGEAVQLNIYLEDDQLRTVNTALSDFTLHSLTFYTYPTTYRL